MTGMLLPFLLLQAGADDADPGAVDPAGPDGGAPEDDGSPSRSLARRGATVPAPRRTAVALRRTSLQRWWDQQGMKVVVVLLLALVVFVHYSRNMFVTVDPGAVGVLWKRLDGGTVMDRTYPEGLHVVLPWNRMFVYDTRLQQIEDTYSVATSDGLVVHVIVSTRFVPNAGQVPALHRLVGPDYVDHLVRAEVGRGVQRVIGSYTSDSLDVASLTTLMEALHRDVEDRIDKRFITLYAVGIDQMEIRNRYKGQSLTR